jgi:5'-nucleotidase
MLECENQMNKPRILVTNDDGIHAPGIRHLWNALNQFADLTIVAPAVEQSAVGLSITLRNPLQISKIDNWMHGSSAWAVTGTPADCVKIALNVILENPPDLIVSGINRGSNAGRNVLYSGTVAAVIEGTLQGIPGIAFSSYDYMQTPYQKAEPYIPKIVEYILENPLPRGSFLNVNFPSLSVEREMMEVKLVRQGKEFWGENPEQRKHPVEGHCYYWLGCKLASFQEEEDSDIAFLRQGYVTAVPVQISELTDHEHIRTQKEHFENYFSNAQSPILSHT